MHPARSSWQEIATILDVVSIQRADQSIWQWYAYAPKVDVSKE
jgi:hypothetical protein